MTNTGDVAQRQPHSVTMVLSATCILTVPILGWITSAFWWRHWGFNSVLYGLTAFGGLSLVAYPAIYLTGLYFYGKHLRRLLFRVPEDQRQIRPSLVWLVLAVPLNFVGSFYVVHGIGRSLLADGRIAVATARRWSAIGIGWAALQLLAFVPNMGISFITALLAYAAWAAHWLDSVRLDDLLADKSEVTHE